MSYSSKLLQDLASAAEALNERQVNLLIKMAMSLNIDLKGEFNADNGLVDENLWTAFGELLLIHHAHTTKPLNKKQFEYTLESACQSSGRHAMLNTSSNRSSWDIIIEEDKFSLKSSTVSHPKLIHISKISEAAWIGDYVERYLQDGKYVVGEVDLAGLCQGIHDNLVTHIKRYDRILKLRTFSRGKHLEYRFAEIPRGLLLEMTRLTKSDLWRSAEKTIRAQVTRDGKILFEVNLDVSVEKLKITHLDVSNCIAHASWIIPLTS